MKISRKKDTATAVFFLLKNITDDSIMSSNLVRFAHKGQGNYEGIGKAARKNVFSILVSKCPVIARDIGCEINDLVLNSH